MAPVRGGTGHIKVWAHRTYGSNSEEIPLAARLTDYVLDLSLRRCHAVWLLNTDAGWTRRWKSCWETGPGFYPSESMMQLFFQKGSLRSF